MIKIKLVGDIDHELTRLGLKAGDEIQATLDPVSKVGAANFTVMYNGFSCDCVVWPDNYIIISDTSKPERGKFYPKHEDLLAVGFKHEGEGDDPRDYWYKIDLMNTEAKDGNKISLCLDAYFDFTLFLVDIEMPLNFQSIQEVNSFILAFTRPLNHAYSNFMDIFKS